MQHLYAMQLYWFVQQNKTGLHAKEIDMIRWLTPTGDPKRSVIEYNPIDGGHIYKLKTPFCSVSLVANWTGRALASCIRTNRRAFCAG
jgi:hypothetical protein